MNKQDIINNAVHYVQELLKQDATGHDWWHVYRVWQTSIFLVKQEQADHFIVELAALLHDIDDWKFNSAEDVIKLTKARSWLHAQQVPESDIERICQIIHDMSFKGAKVQSSMQTLEGKIVQDADRLDAIGAIGIARAFAYGAHKGDPLYDPNIPVTLHTSFDEYKRNKGSTINHFHEKLLLLIDLMNTASAKAIAKKRHAYMQAYLQQFHLEWQSEDLVSAEFDTLIQATSNSS